VYKAALVSKKWVVVLKQNNFLNSALFKSQACLDGNGCSFEEVFLFGLRSFVQKRAWKERLTNDCWSLIV
jgi:hypothetical protein